MGPPGRCANLRPGGFENLLLQPESGCAAGGRLASSKARAQRLLTCPDMTDKPPKSVALGALLMVWHNRCWRGRSTWQRKQPKHRLWQTQGPTALDMCEAAKEYLCWATAAVCCSSVWEGVWLYWMKHCKVGTPMSIAACGVTQCFSARSRRRCRAKPSPSIHRCLLHQLVFAGVRRTLRPCCCREAAQRGQRGSGAHPALDLARRAPL